MAVNTPIHLQTNHGCRIQRIIRGLVKQAKHIPENETYACTMHCFTVFVRSLSSHCVAFSLLLLHSLRHFFHVSRSFSVFLIRVLTLQPANRLNVAFSTRLSFPCLLGCSGTHRLRCVRAVSLSLSLSFYSRLCVCCSYMCHQWYHFATLYIFVECGAKEIHTVNYLVFHRCVHAEKISVQLATCEFIS